MNGKKYLLDTNIIIDFLQGREILLDKFSSAAYISIPHIVTGELYYGAALSRNPVRNLKKVKGFLKSFDILASDDITSEYYAKIKKQLKLHGKPIPENDVWIAALARQYDLILVTNDQHLKLIDTLTIESW
jgi:tRNA(fMet)-specific endonuclease VapC